MRVQEDEPIVFECQYSGTPVPDIIWYRNDKIIRNTKNVQIRIKDNKTSCTILHVTPEDEGTYVCKASSDIGMETTRGRLTVQELPQEERVKIEVLRAKEEHEKVKLERVQLEKKREERRKKKGFLTFETEGSREIVDVQETQILESTKQFTETTKKATAEKILSIREPVMTSATATCKKVEEKVTILKGKPQDKAEKIMPIQESVTISEIQPEDVVKEFKEKKPRKIAQRTAPVQESVTVSEVLAEGTVKEFVDKKVQEKAKSIVSTQKSVSISEVVAETTVKEFKQKVVEERAERLVPVQESVTISEVQSEATVKELQEKRPKVRRAKPEKKSALKETATVTEVKSEMIVERKRVIKAVEEIMEVEETKMATEVEELLKFVRAKEFGPGESPLRELAQIGFLVRRGVTVSEITTLYEADRFPALRTPEAQSAMVQLVERQGHGPLISQVLTEESTTDEATVAATIGFRAFMRMVELKHASVEQVITHFAPEDFRPHAWETTEATQVITKDEAVEKVKISESTEVHVQAHQHSTELSKSQATSRMYNCLTPLQVCDGEECLFFPFITLTILCAVLLKVIVWLLGVIWTYEADDL